MKEKISTNPHSVSNNASMKLKKVNDPFELDEICRGIIERTLLFCQADYCKLVISNPIDDSIVRVYTFDTEKNRVIRIDEKPPYLSKTDQNTLDENDIIARFLPKTQNTYNKLFDASSPIKTFIALKLQAPRSERKKILGHIYLGYKNKLEDINAESDVADHIAKEAASILQHTWSIRRYKDVAEIGKDINKELKEPAQIFDSMIEHLPNILDSSCYFMMGVYKQNAHKLDFYLLKKNVESKELDFELEGACKYVIDRNEEVIVKDFPNERTKLEKKGIFVVHRNTDEDKIPDSMMFVPLHIRDTTLGVLSVQKDTPHAFDNEDRQILELLSHFVALALSNVRWKSGLENLIKTGQELAQKLDDEDSMLKEIVDLVKKQTNADVAFMIPYDKRRYEFLQPIISEGKFNSKDYKKQINNLTNSASQRVSDYAEPLFCNIGELYELVNKVTGTKLDRDFFNNEKIESVAVLPLKQAGKSVGILCLNFRKPQLFTDSQKYLIEGLAIFISIALTNVSDFKGIKQRQLNNLIALREIDHKIINSNDRKEIFETVLHYTKQNLHIEKEGRSHGTILIYDQETNSLVVESHIGENAKIRINKSIPLSEKRGFTYQAWKEQKPIRIADVKGKKRYLRIDERTKSELDTPIIEHGKSIGVISFESNQLDFFNSDDEEFLITVANQVAVGISKTKAFQHEKKAKENEAVIGSVAKKIIEDRLTFEQLTALILEKSLLHTDSDAGAVFIHNKECNDFHIIAEKNIEPEKSSARISDENELIGLTYRRRKSFIVNYKNPPFKMDFAPLSKKAKWALCVPVYKNIQNIFIGVVLIEGQTKYTEQDQQLIEELADLAVIAFELINAQETLKTLNETGKQLNKIVDSESLQTAYKIIGSTLQNEESIQVVIRRYKAENQKLTKVWQATDSTAPFESIKITSNKYIYEKFLKKETVIITNTDELQDEIKQDLSDQSIKSLIIVWVTFQEKIYGSISLTHAQKDYFQDIDLKLIEGLAQMLGATINRVELEKQSRELEVVATVGEIAYELAHRIGNYLGWADPYFSELKKSQTPLDNKMLDRLLGRVSQVVNQSRKTKKVFFSLREVEKEVIPANQLFNQIQEHLPEIRPEIDVIWKIERNLPNLYVVKSHIESIISNLLINAAEAISQEGHIIISVRHIDGYVEIKIEDNGCGIDPEIEDTIFDLNITTKANNENTGFGLWSAKRSAIANGGNLTCISEIGEGTTFTLILPVQLT
ncbi:MAG TPA: GAF domain-containing protein [Pyrinomonadaceae bacterium]|nr:GAF domain-containing protein [Pyrinomonadaceae bacterium]